MAEDKKKDLSDAAEITTTDKHQPPLMPFHLQSDLHTESVDDLLDYLMGIPLLDSPTRSRSDEEVLPNGTTSSHVEGTEGGSTSATALETRYKPERHISFTDDRGHKVAKFADRLGPEESKEETDGFVDDATAMGPLSESGADNRQSIQQTKILPPIVVERTPEGAWMESEVSFGHLFDISKR